LRRRVVGVGVTALVLAQVGSPGSGATASYLDEPVEQASAIPRLEGDEKSRVEELEESTWTACRAGEFDLAYSAAREVWEIRSRRQGSTWWEAVEWRERADLLDQVTRMPDESQCQLAEVYERDRECRQWFGDEKYAEVIAGLQASLAVRRSILGADHWEVGQTLLFLGRAYFRAPDYQDAERHLRSALEIYGQGPFLRHPVAADCMYNLADVLLERKAGRRDVLAEALSLSEKAAALYREAYGAQHISVARSLAIMGGCLKDSREFQRAEQCVREALAIYRVTAPEEETSIAQLVQLLSLAVFEQGREEEGMALLREEIGRRTSGSGFSERGTAGLQHNLALFHDRRGEYDEAEPLYKASLESFRKLLPENHISLAISEASFGFFLHRVGKFNDAEQYLRNALRIFHVVHGVEHWRSQITASRLAVSLADKGDFEEAERLFLEVEEVYRRVPHVLDPYRMANLRNLADVYVTTGEYAAAETLFRQVLSSFRIEFGEASHYFGSVCSQLAGLLRRKGQLGEAEQLARKAVAMIQQACDCEVHWDIAVALRTLADILLDRGDYEGAEAAARQAARMFETEADKRHSSHLIFWNTLATALIAAGKPEEAEAVAWRQIHYIQDEYGADYYAAGSAYMTLGDALAAMPKLTEAENAFREAIRILRKRMGDHHPTTARALHRLAGLLEEKGEYQAALPLCREAFAITEQNRSRITGDERTRAAFSRALDMKVLSNELANLLIRVDDAEGALSALERGRSRALLDLLSRSNRDLVAVLREQGDPQTVAELEEALESERQALFAMRTAEGELRVAEATERADGSRASVIQKRASAAVAARMAFGDAEAAVFGLLRAVWPDATPLAPSQVRKTLRPGELMLVFSETDEAIGVLLIPPSGAGEIEGAFVAQTRSEVESLRKSAFGALGGMSRAPNHPAAREAGAEARYGLFKKLLPGRFRDRVLHCRRLVVIPDGVTRQLPLESLVVSLQGGERGRPIGFLEVGPPVVYADSATVYANRRDIGRSRETRRATQMSALVVGAPDFRSHEQPLDYPQRGLVVSSVEPDGIAARAGIKPDDVLLAYDGQTITGTDDTVEAMAEAAATSKPDGGNDADLIDVEYWRDGRTQTIALSRGSLGVHFWEGSPANVLEAQRRCLRSVGEGTAEASVLDQIRLYGGALLPLEGTRHEAQAVGRLVGAAGGSADILLDREATIANVEARVEGKRYVHIATHGIVGSETDPYSASLALAQPELPTPDDFGFLTLDRLVRNWRGKLNDCDLVVLSACETTKGVATGGSSIALPWGFMYAGAPSVVASLWKVDDAATTLLMTRFYENLLGQYTERRGSYDAQTAMPNADALREAKTWLRSLPPDGIRTLVQRGGLAAESVKSLDEERVYDFSNPYYWAAFVLIGDPD